MDRLDRYKRARVERIRKELIEGQFSGNSDGACALRDLLETIDDMAPPPKTPGELLFEAVNPERGLNAWEHARKDIWEKRAVAFIASINDQEQETVAT